MSSGGPYLTISVLQKLVVIISFAIEILCNLALAPAIVGGMFQENNISNGFYVWVRWGIVLTSKNTLSFEFYPLLKDSFLHNLEVKLSGVD